MPTGSQLRVVCHYDNDTDEPVKGGASGFTEEMCTAVAVYWPVHDYKLPLEIHAVSAPGPL